MTARPGGNFRRVVAGSIFGLLALTQARAATAQEVASAASPVVTHYGVGVRVPQWLTVPGWFLNLFTAENVPLSTVDAYGFDLFARRNDYDIVLGLSYQNMSAPDGNWLGKGKDASIDTDLVQPRGVALLGAEIGVVWRRMFTGYFGLHAGGGLGLAIVKGEVLRTSNSSRCTRENAGNEELCRPIACEPNGCTEARLKATEGGVDGGPNQPSRFADPDIPGAFPILNLVVGLDFRLPEVPGLEARIEGGFHDGFILGTSFAYVFF